MKKYVVYLFDGTTQDFKRDKVTDWSNIVRLHALLHKSAFAPGSKLLDFYGDGVGCRHGELLLGSTLGWGLERRLEEAYLDLGTQVALAMKNSDELKIYVFGFSRGAYEARVFCELVASCGVPGGDGSYCEAYDHLRRHDVDSMHRAMRDGRYCPAPAIEFLGVFDTVKMTDVADDIDIGHLPGIVRHACHAMSYNERRAIFPLTRFAPNEPNVEEVWFLGSHTDIGGGYETRGLADRSLEWMIEKVNKHGLPVIYGPIEDDTANHAVRFNDSFSILQGIGGFCVRGKWQELRETRTDDVFHWSVQDEREQFAGIVPELPEESMIAYTPRHEQLNTKGMIA